MPSPLMTEVTQLFQAFHELDRQVMTTQMGALTLRKSLGDQAKVFKDFIAGCDDGFSSRLKKIEGVKPDKLDAECEAILKIVEKYLGLVRKAQSQVPVGLTDNVPLVLSHLNDLAVALKKIGGLLEDQKKAPPDKALLARIANSGKVWSEMKSIKQKRVADGVAVRMKEYEFPDVVAAMFDKLRPCFSREVLSKLEQLDQAPEPARKAGAAKLLPAVEAMQKKTLEFCKSIKNKGEGYGGLLAAAVEGHAGTLRATLASLAKG